MNTKIEYMYRDANNYKVLNTCVVYGEISERQKDAIINSLDEEKYFIPSKVGLPEKGFSDYIPEVDHKWFELYKDSFEDTELPATVNITVEELVDNFFRWIERWDEDRAISCKEVE